MRIPVDGSDWDRFLFYCWQVALAHAEREPRFKASQHMPFPPTADLYGLVCMSQDEEHEHDVIWTRTHPERGYVDRVAPQELRLYVAAEPMEVMAPAISVERWLVQNYWSIRAVDAMMLRTVEAPKWVMDLVRRDFQLKVAVFFLRKV